MFRRRSRRGGGLSTTRLRRIVASPTQCRISAPAAGHRPRGVSCSSVGNHSTSASTADKANASKVSAEACLFGGRGGIRPTARELRRRRGYDSTAACGHRALTSTSMSPFAFSTGRRTVPPFVDTNSSRGLRSPDRSVRGVRIGDERFGLGPLGDSLTVEQRTLTPLVLVRIQVPQPKLSENHRFVGTGLTADAVVR